MNKIVIAGVVILLLLFYMFKQNTQQNMPIMEKYPWQVTVLPDGRTRIFGVILNETTLKEIDAILKSTPTVALFESEHSLALEAYYKNVVLGGLIGSFIFSLDAPDEQLRELKKQSKPEKKRTENNEIRYELDKIAIGKTKKFVVSNLIYIPTVQLDEDTIVKRFGKPAYKIALKTKEKGWHYLYPEKGLDLIFKEEGKEALQYVQPESFNLLLEPLQFPQNQKH